jgi:hypothetical protein
MALPLQWSCIAGQKGCFIESVCLAAAIIDGMLRIGLILQHQIHTRPDELLDELLYQSDEDKIVSERTIYQRALNAEVIDHQTFDLLQGLYDKRNRVVHRYIISEITTQEVLFTAIEFDSMVKRVSQAIGKIEARQIELDVGMTKQSDTHAIIQDLMKMSEQKHGRRDLAKKLREEGT